MEKNIEIIEHVVDYIETHLEEKLGLDEISWQAGYSKYHLHKMFVSIVGIPLHTYIRRRRLTEAARLLVCTDRPVMDIALASGYETQQSFTVGFRSVFRCSPQKYRKRNNFHPLQLKFSVDGNKTLRGDLMMDVRMEDRGRMLLAGFSFNTRTGFFGMGKCWKKLHETKQVIPDRADPDFLVGLNDYSAWDPVKEKQPAFDYLAAAEVKSFSGIPKGMKTQELPAGKYAVFTFRAKSQDSLQPAADYIYKTWFPQSTCRLNEAAKYDFAKYGEQVDENGMSIIEYWIPIL